MPSLYCRLCRVPGARLTVLTVQALEGAGSVGGFCKFLTIPMLRVTAVSTLITHKVCSASRLAADITFFTSHADPFKVVRLSEYHIVPQLDILRGLWVYGTKTVGT